MATQPTAYRFNQGNTANRVSRLQLTTNRLSKLQPTANRTSEFYSQQYRRLKIYF